MFKKHIIIGGGQIGLAIATLISPKLEEVYIFDKNPKVSERFSQIQNINIITQLPQKIEEPTLIILAIPSSAVLEILNKITLTKKTYILSLTKGLTTNGQFISKLIPKNRFAVLSGPNFADEIIENKKSFSTLASKNKTLRKNLKKLLETTYFSIETTDDTIGVEACGTFKNVYAIGSGLLTRNNLNKNSYYYYIGEFLREFTNLIKDIGGKKKTATLNCGFGDFLLTCLSNKSRNKRYGEELKEEGTTEGLNTLRALNSEFIKKFKYLHAIKQSITTKKDILKYI